jgi:hypothetical protein
LLPPICNSLKFNINCTAISRDSLSSLTPLPCPIFSSVFVALPRPHLIRYQNKTGCNHHRRTGITIINRRSIDVEVRRTESCTHSTTRDRAIEDFIRPPGQWIQRRCQ